MVEITHFRGMSLSEGQKDTGARDSSEEDSVQLSSLAEGQHWKGSKRRNRTRKLYCKN